MTDTEAPFFKTTTRSEADLRMWRAATEKLKSKVTGRTVNVYGADAAEVVRRLEQLHEQAEQNGTARDVTRCTNALAAVRKNMIDGTQDAADEEIAQRREDAAASDDDANDAPVQPATREPLGSPDIADEHGNVPSDAAKMRLADYNKMKEEAKMVKTAEKAGRTRPATPTLDKVSARKASGNGGSSKAATKRQAEAPVAPKTARNETAVFLKSAKHADLIRKARTGAKIVDSHLIVAQGNANAVLDKLHAANLSDEAGIYDKRLYVATAVQLRHDFPNAEGGLGGVTERLVDGLNVLAANKKIADWHIAIHIDGTLRWGVTNVKGGLSLPVLPEGDVKDATTARTMLTKVDAGLVRFKLVDEG